MVRHEIKNQFQAVVVCFGNQCVEIRHRTKNRIDAGVVGDIVAEIGHRRWIDRRKPERVNSETSQIGQSLDNSPEISDAVVIGILERAWIDLIEYSALPPAAIGHCHSSIPRAGKGPSLNMPLIQDVDLGTSG